MTNPQIVDYVRDERARGVADSDIEKALKEKGWKGEDVESALKPQVAMMHGSGLFKGRLDKGNFLKVFLVGLLLQIGISFLGAGSMMGSTMGYGGDMFGSASFGGAILGLAIMVILGLVIMVYQIGATIRRLHDIGLTGWYALAIILLSFIPFLGMLIGLGVVIYLIITPGDPKENMYGAVPNPNITLWQAIKGSV